MIRTNQTLSIFPDYVSVSVLDLKTDELKNAGITHLALDIDETVVPKNHNQISKEYIHFLQLLEAQGFQLLIASNSRRNLSTIMQDIDAQLIVPSQTSFKPLKSYFSKVIEAAQTGSSHIAMIGDKIINDVVGANRAGLKTILVEPYARQQKFYNRLYLWLVLRRVA